MVQKIEERTLSQKGSERMGKYRGREDMQGRRPHGTSSMEGGGFPVSPTGQTLEN